MKKLLPFIVILLICLIGCSSNSVSVKPTQIYCPAPTKPILEKVDKITIPFLLMELTGVVEYSLALELQVKCYEAVLGIDVGHSVK